MRPLKGSRMLLRLIERRGAKRLGANHVAIVFGSNPSARAVCARSGPAGDLITTRALREGENIAPSRNKRSVVRAISSCNGVPTIWAIKPIITAGCAVMISCDGDRTALAVSTTEQGQCFSARGYPAQCERAGNRREAVCDRSSYACASGR